jgi:tetraprenyl-beta-curcumene synthase
MSSPLAQLTRPAHEATLRDAGHVPVDRLLLARASSALLLANARYWPAVAPRVRAQLRRWEGAARAIPDPFLRELALGKLADERFNVEVAATLATLAPRAHRGIVVEAIVALQVLYDYLDVLGEQPSADPLRDGERLLRTFTDAVAVGATAPRKTVEKPLFDDGVYRDELARAVVVAIARLPKHNAIVPVAQAAAARCAEAQILNHAAPSLGTAPAEEWAIVKAHGTPFGWQELLAGASASVLSIHALIAAAADPDTTPEGANAIDAAYLSIGALTMLDSVVDYDDDLASGQQGYLQYYDDPNRLSERLAWIAREATARARALPHAAHHLMTLAGVGAYYLSSPGARTDFARPITGRVHDELRPLITPILALMRAWRATKRVRR